MNSGEKIPHSDKAEEVHCPTTIAEEALAKPLDLRTTKCPLNFVKARLALEKLPVGSILEIWILANSQSALNIPKSIQQEGHLIMNDIIEPDGILRRISVRRAAK